MNDNNLRQLITNAINLKFTVLIQSHKEYLKEYVLKISNLLISYYGYDIIGHLSINNYSDIYGLIVLLLPYFKLDKSNIIKSLDEIINIDTQNKEDYNFKKKIENTFYIDHVNMNVENYIKNSYKLIEITLFKTANRLMPNWINIFPLKIENYEKNEISLNLTNLYQTKSFNKENLKLHYTTLYGCCVNFLYNDIKKIKWLIYDIIDDNKLYPTIIYIGEILNYRNFTLPFDKLSQTQIHDFESSWNIAKINNDKIFKMKSMLLFYYRFNSEKYDQIKLEIHKIFKKNISVSSMDDFELEDFLQLYSDDLIFLNILQYLISNITTEEIYTYIYKSIQQFKYTVYGYFCLNDNEIKTSDDFFNKYLGGFLNQNTENMLYYLSPKMIYNYFKNLVCHTVSDKYEPYTNSADWNELSETLKSDFIIKLNKNIFNIPVNYKKLYSSYQDYTQKYNELNAYVYSSNIIPKTIYYSLCYNGILTEIIFKKNIMDEKKIPDKNVNEEIYNNYIKSRIDIYGRNFINNKEYSEESKKLIIDSGWFLLFGSNWICQLQQFHHFLHNRVMFITGSTGAGKSTIFPMVMLYAYKAFLFMNNPIIYDTQPRIKPTQQNAERIYKQLGFEIDKNNINIIQYSTGDNKITDDEYHPILRFYTDKSIIQLIIKNPILKYNLNNIVDMILIDESHENNTNMTIILTLLKYAAYINNSLSIGMVSATMDYDEVIYRKFYQIIDDNYKYPLDMFLYKDNINRTFMDRRIHMSKPFSSTNFKITEIQHIDNSVSQNQNIYNILKKILGKKEDGQDILIFKNGQKDIKELRDFLTQQQLPKHVCILPFYSELKDYEKNIVADISNPVVRESFKNPQYANPFDDSFPSNKKINYTYTQFIIISTNIAEASLTIKSLKYVIDTGEHKIKEYNLKTFQSSLKTKQIAKQNQLQRIGRSGRTKQGVAYYTYNHNELTLDPIYKIQIEDYKNLIFELYTDDNTQEITTLNDPNLITNPDRLIESLIKQYTLTDNKLFNYPKNNTSQMPPIHYPYNGKYHSPELIDRQNRFYITNPTKYIIDENMKLKNVVQPENVMNETFEHLKKMKMFNKQSDLNYVITDFGKTVLKVLNLYDNEYKIELTDLFCILHTFSISQHVKLCEYLLHMIIIKIIFGSTTFILNIDTKIKNVKNEFEYKSKLIPIKYYNLYSKYFSNINILDVKKSNSNLMSIVKNIINGINIIIEDTENYKDTNEEKIEFYKAFLTQYYYHYIIIQFMINNKILCGITSNFLKEFKSDFLCFYTGNNRNDTIFQCLMIKYHHNNIIRKINKKDYVYYKIKNPSEKDEIYTLNSYSFVFDKNNVLYLNKNDDSEVSNLMTIDMWLLNKFKSR